LDTGVFRSPGRERAENFFLAHAEFADFAEEGYGESAENCSSRGAAEPRRAPCGSVALRRLRGVIRIPGIWLFAPGGSTFAGWSGPRPAGCAAGWGEIPPEETTFTMNVDPGEERSATRRT